MEKKEENVKQQVRANDRVEILGIEMEWKLTRADTADRYCVLVVTMPPGSGVPAHQHPQQEAFFILEGTPEFAVENSGGLVWRTISQGEMVNIPSDAMHGFRNSSDRNVRVVLTCEAGLADFFEEAGLSLAENESPSGNLSPEAIHRVIEIATKHGQRFAPHA
jgi:quercetin dioxygenase-like cupin family protein